MAAGFACETLHTIHIFAPIVPVTGCTSWNLPNSILLYKHNLHFKLSAYNSSETQCVHHPTEKDPEFGFRAFELNTYGTESFRNFREGHFNRKCVLKTVSFSFYVSRSFLSPLTAMILLFSSLFIDKKENKIYLLFQQWYLKQKQYGELF